MLMFVIFILSVLQYALHYIMNLCVVPIKRLLLLSPSYKDFNNMQVEMQALVEKQKKISMMDEFAKYARLQRKIDALKQKISTISSKFSQQVLIIRTAAYWIARVTIAIAFIYISIMYRYEPVWQFNAKHIPFGALAWIIAFPTGVYGNIGCIFWVLLNQITLRTVFKRFNL